MDGITVRDVTKVQARSAVGWSWGDGDVHTYSLVQGALFTTCSIRSDLSISPPLIAVRPRHTALLFLCCPQ